MWMLWAYGKSNYFLGSGTRGLQIIAGIDLAVAQASFSVYRSIQEVCEQGDVIIDFSHPSLLSEILNFVKEKKISAVLCTTGYTPEQVKELTDASQSVPIFYSQNMSMGINLLIELSKKAAKVLGNQFDIE
ncbi:MAG: 4-hydroxy-tetrahydrodipicolinate reductase, partial [Oscillospiraceae bacterium]